MGYRSLLLTVASDSGAYFAGRSLGRTKLAEKVSPHKTVECAIGGLLATIAAGLILAPMFAPEWPTVPGDHLLGDHFHRGANSAICPGLPSSARRGSRTLAGFSRAMAVCSIEHVR